MAGLSGEMDWDNNYNWGSGDDLSSDFSWEGGNYDFTAPNSSIGLNGNSSVGLQMPSDYNFGDYNFGSGMPDVDTSGLMYSGSPSGVGLRMPGMDIGLKDTGYQNGLNTGSMDLNIGNGASGSTHDFIKQLLQNPDKFMKGLAALFEGNQNKKYASSLNKIANNPMIDPFGSQRPFYQQQLQSAIQNPMQVPIVAAQLKGIQEVQNRKDAAAGRRSNVVGSAPAVMQAQGQVMQNYINSLMQPAGAGIAPNSSALAQLSQQAAKANSQGYASPIFSAIGQMNQDDLLRAIIAKL